MTARGKAALCAVFCVAACRETPRSDDVPVAPPEPPPVASPCAPLICTPFATSEQALSFVLDLRPRVIAFGESHALRGGADVMTATERFGADYLPLLRDRGASTLVVELINPPTGCEQEKAAVVEVQKPVVERQDAGNQERFVALGHRARALRMTPLLLEPACSDFAPVRQAGPDGVAALLELIANQTRAKLERLAAKTTSDELLVAYGGAVHNDIAIEGQSKPFAFGAELSRVTGGRYVAVDLIVPEFVGDTDVWKALPWYPHWPELATDGVTLIQTNANEFTLILERGRRRAAPEGPPSAVSSVVSGGLSGPDRPNAPSSGR